MIQDRKDGTADPLKNVPKVTDMQITFDEGYQFGLGFFETISVEHGQPIFLSWHLERLCRSMEEFGIEQDICPEQISEFLASRETEHHALKIMVSKANKIFTMRPNPYTEMHLQKGFRLSYSSVYRNETSPLVFHKSMNYGDCILEKRRAGSLGADEMIFLNSRGEICEGTTTNIFFVKNGTIYTPPLSCGLLPGILRHFLMESFPVEECILRKEDASQMDECFVTNSLMGVMPVTALGSKEYISHTVTRRCMEAYRQLTVPPPAPASGPRSVSHFAAL